MREALKKAKILIVDDQEANTYLLEQILQQGGYYDMKSTNDARRVLPIYTEFQPDLILLDLMMPYLDGFEIMKQLKSRISEDTCLPILVLTADTSSEVKQRVLSM
jgi:CheY-like chemotaxis protein